MSRAEIPESHVTESDPQPGPPGLHPLHWNQIHLEGRFAQYGPAPSAQWGSMVKRWNCEEVAHVSHHSVDTNLISFPPAPRACHAHPIF